MISVRLYAPIPTARGVIERFDFDVPMPLALPARSSDGRLDIDVAKAAEIIMSAGDIDASVFARISGIDMAMITAVLFSPRRVRG